MQFVLDMPSLEHISQVTTAIDLWKRHPISCYKAMKSRKKLWPNLENDMCKRVDALILPKCLKPELRTLVRHVGRQLRDWLKLLKSRVFDRLSDPLVKSLIECTQWTMHGKLDVTKTARILARMESLTIKARFDIACMFAIADEVWQLWKIFTDSEEEKTPVESLMYNFWKTVSFDVDSPQITDEMKSEAFLKALSEQNQSALEYLWSIMREDERTASLATFAHTGFQDLAERIISDHVRTGGDGCSPATGIMCFLLSQMSKTQVQLGSRLCYSLLFDFYTVDFFTSCSDQSLNSTSGHFFYETILGMSEMSSLTKCLHFPKIRTCFTHLWTTTPPDVRSYVRGHKLALVVTQLCNSKDWSNLELLLSDLCENERRRILSKCLCLLLSEEYPLNWDFIEAVSRECITSSEEMTTFKASCSKIAYRVCSALTERENQWPTAEKFLHFCFDNNTTEIEKFKKCFGFYYFTRDQEKKPKYYMRTLFWPQIRSLFIAEDEEENNCAMSCSWLCSTEDFTSIELLFSGKSVVEIRRILSICFTHVVAFDRCSATLDFIQVIARNFITTDDEMDAFKEHCSCFAYQVCNGIFDVDDDDQWPLIDKYLSFSFKNPRELSDFKTSIPFDYYIRIISSDDEGELDHEVDLELLNEMLTWCGLSSNQVTDFLAIYPTIE